MNGTVVAIYDDIAQARQVVEELVNADFARNSISLITNDANNRYSHYLAPDYTARTDAVTAGEGAGFGAVIGGLTGVLAGLAALTIPGIGLAIAAGPVVAGLTGILAGAVTGGVVGALVKTGVPVDDAPYYAEGIRRGGTLVSIDTADTSRAQDILHRFGSINIHERVDVWRQQGWKGFNADNGEGTGGQSAEMGTTVTTDTTITRVTQRTSASLPAVATPGEMAVEGTASIMPPEDSGADAGGGAYRVMISPPQSGDGLLPMTPIKKAITDGQLPPGVEVDIITDDPLDDTVKITNHPIG